jgi:hypothetical protein
MAASSWVGVILKSFSIDVGTTTGKPPDNLQFQNSSPSKGLVKLLHHHHLTVQCYIKIVLLLWKLQFVMVYNLNHCLFEFSADCFFQLSISIYWRIGAVIFVDRFFSCFFDKV